MDLTLVDSVQQNLAESVFYYSKDRKKAAGRAMGTLVELITYYTLWSWNLASHVLIERRVPEFGNSDIQHNVEFTLHPVLKRHYIEFPTESLPVTGLKIQRQLGLLVDQKFKSTQVLSKNLVKRNSAVIHESTSCIYVADVVEYNKSRCKLEIRELRNSPLAVVECKRVGVEQGMTKGPTTIEKAKQGAYVARTISALQKVRLMDGTMYGIIERQDGELVVSLYSELMKKLIIEADSGKYPDFILTIGIVSNHGNWFTSNSQNKELRVLAASFDWLLFLTDVGLLNFVNQFILHPSKILNRFPKHFWKVTVANEEKIDSRKFSWTLMLI